MITIVSALKGEFSPLMEHFEVRQREPFGNGMLYLCSDIHFFRTGIGSTNVRQTFGKYLEKYKPAYILNIGLAGSLDALCSVHTICAIAEISDAVSHRTLQLEPHEIFADINRARLVTVHKALTDVSLRNAISAKYKAHLVDMEVFPLAELAGSYTVPFNAVKIVSDHADSTAKDDFLKNYREVASSLGSYLLKKVYQLSKQY